MDKGDVGKKNHVPIVVSRESTLCSTGQSSKINCRESPILQLTGSSRVRCFNLSVSFGLPLLSFIFHLFLAGSLIIIQSIGYQIMLSKAWMSYRICKYPLRPLSIPRI